ncbi:MAG: spermidine synthase [Actinomycetes bacterium]
MTPPRRPARAASRRPEARSYEVSTGTAELVPDRSDPDLWTLWLNGVPSSAVHLTDPTALDFEYMRWMADVIDAAKEPGRPLDVVHLGGAACALPRYVEATRPGSRQVVVEVDEQLARLVRELFDLPRSPSLRIQTGDARERLRQRRDDTADLVVRDVFGGDVTPAHLTTVEYVADVARVLRPDGVYLANVADRPPLGLLRSEVATLRAVFPATAMLTETALLRGRRYANAVLVGANEPLPVADLARRLASAAVPTRLVTGAQLVALQGSTAPLVDPA